VAPLFSCHYNGYRIRLHTHARADHLLFNLGPGHGVFEKTDAGVQHRKLKSQAASCWTSLTKPGKVSKAVKVTLKLGIPPANTDDTETTEGAL
jgi:hypothetical protein